MVVEDRTPIRLAADEISVRFGGVVALDDVSIEFGGPSIVGVVGPNGSGKSTLMGVLSGLVKPGRGRVELDGYDLTGKSPLRYAKRGIRRSFQTVRLTPSLTIRDNLLVGLARTGPEDLRRAEEVAETFGFADYLKRWPSEVPAGVQRLVQVGSVVLTRPSVVLLGRAGGRVDRRRGDGATARHSRHWQPSPRHRRRAQHAADLRSDQPGGGAHQWPGGGRRSGGFG